MNILEYLELELECVIKINNDAKPPYRFFYENEIKAKYLESIIAEIKGIQADEQKKQEKPQEFIDEWREFFNLHLPPQSYDSAYVDNKLKQDIRDIKKCLIDVDHPFKKERHTFLTFIDRINAHQILEKWKEELMEKEAE